MGAPSLNHGLRSTLAQVPPRQQAVLFLRLLCDQPVSAATQMLLGVPN
jgi:hypothetical protein